MSDPREGMREIQRMASWVCTLILSSDLPAIDIEIESGSSTEFVGEGRACWEFRGAFFKAWQGK